MDLNYKIILSTFTVTNNRFNIYVSIVSASMFNLMYFERFVKDSVGVEYIFIYKNVNKLSCEAGNETSLIKKDKTKIYLVLSITSFSNLIKNNQNNLSFQEFKNWLNNQLIIFLGITWDEALSEFEKNDINITIGPSNKRFILRSHEYRLSSICYFLNINENAIFEGSNDKNLIKIPVKKIVSKPKKKEKNIIFFENIIPVESIVKLNAEPISLTLKKDTKSEQNKDILQIEGPKALIIKESTKPKIESKIESKIEPKIEPQTASEPKIESQPKAVKPKLKRHKYVELFKNLCCVLLVFLILNEIKNILLLNEIKIILALMDFKFFIKNFLIVIIKLLIIIIKSLIYILEVLKNILIYFVSGLN